MLFSFAGWLMPPPGIGRTQQRARPGFPPPRRDHRPGSGKLLFGARSQKRPRSKNLLLFWYFFLLRAADHSSVRAPTRTLAGGEQTSFASDRHARRNFTRPQQEANARRTAGTDAGERGGERPSERGRGRKARRTATSEASAERSGTEPQRPGLDGPARRPGPAAWMPPSFRRRHAKRPAAKTLGEPPERIADKSAFLRH